MPHVILPFKSVATELLRLLLARLLALLLLLLLLCGRQHLEPRLGRRRVPLAALITAELPLLAFVAAVPPAVLIVLAGHIVPRLGSDGDGDCFVRGRPLAAFAAATELRSLLLLRLRSNG